MVVRERCGNGAHLSGPQYRQGMATPTGRELYDAIAKPYGALEQTRVAGTSLHGLAEDRLAAIKNGSEPAQLMSFWEEVSRYSSLVDVEMNAGKGALETAARGASGFDAASPVDKEHELRGTRQAVEELLNFTRGTGMLEELTRYAANAAKHGHGLPEAAQQLSALNSQLGALERELETYAQTLERGLDMSVVPELTVDGLPAFEEFVPAGSQEPNVLEKTIPEVIAPAPSGPGYDNLTPDPALVGEYPWLAKTARQGFKYDQPVDVETGRPGLLPDLTGEGRQMVTMSGRQISAAQSLDAGFGDELKAGDARVGIGAAGALDAETAGYGYDRAR